MQLIRLLATFTAVLLGGHLLSSCGGKTSPKSSGGNEGPSGPTSEIELSGSIADEAPVDFVQSSSSVSVGRVNLTDATSYVVKAYSLDPSGSKKEIFTGSFAEPNFSFKSTVARQYMLIEITRLPDGGQYGAVLPPPTSNKQASLVVDGATTIAAKMAALIASKAESGDQGAQQALTSGSVSVADLLMVAQSVRTTVIEQKEKNKGSAIDLSSLAANLISKSNELIAKLSAEGQSGAAVAEKLSQASYQTIFGDDAKVASAGILAYRVNPDLGSSEAAKTTVAYEAIKAAGSDNMKPVDEAFRVESTTYRTASSVAAAVAAKTTVASDFKAVFSSCMSLPSSCAQTSYTPPPPQSSAVEPVKAPGAPTGVTGTAGNNQVSLNWTAPANNGGSAITGYLIQHSANGGSTWSEAISTDSTSTYHTVTGLTNGTAYLFRVAAVNALGAGSYSGPSASVTPPVPWTDVTVGSDITMRDNATGLWWSNDRGAMIWEDAKSHCENLSYRGAGAGSWRLPSEDELRAAYFKEIKTQGRTGWITNFNERFWSSFGLLPPTVAVGIGVAVNLADGSRRNNFSVSNNFRVVCVGVKQLDAPSAVTGTAGSTQVSLRWTAPANTTETAITHYWIQYSSNGGSTWSEVISTGSTSTSHTVTGLTNGTAYVFRVAAVNAWGGGSYSDPSASVTLTYPDTWTDVTVGSDITMRDNATGLWWSNKRESMDWDAARRHCGDLSYNGAMGWRLPTRGELLAAYNNGINVQGRTGWITFIFNESFWSSQNTHPNGALVVNLADGSNGNNVCGNCLNHFVCVR
jgi:hypothetical protein